MRRCFIVVAVLWALGGCTKTVTPEEICASPTAWSAIRDDFYVAAVRRIDGNIEGNPNLDWAAIKAIVPELKADNLFSLNYVVFKGRDRETGAVHCHATVSITVPPRTRSNRFRRTSKASRITSFRRISSETTLQSLSLISPFSQRRIGRRTRSLATMFRRSRRRCWLPHSRSGRSRYLRHLTPLTPTVRPFLTGIHWRTSITRRRSPSSSQPSALLNAGAVDFVNGL